MPVFTDDFTGTNGALLRQRSGWSFSGNVAYQDKATINNNRVKVGGGAGASVYYGYVRSAGAADHYAQAAFRITTGVGAALLVRWVDASNFIGVRNSGTSVVLFKLVAGTLTTVATIATGLVSGDVIRASVEGSTVKLFKNGTQIGAGAGYTVADAALASSQNVGLGCEGNGGSLEYFDDFETDALVTDTLSVTAGAPLPNAVLQRRKGETFARLTPALAYTGAVPDDVQAQVEDASGTVLAAWATLGGVTIGGGTISGVQIDVGQDVHPNPVGRVLRLRSRTAGGTVIASWTSATFTVGALTACGGQSLMVGTFGSTGSIAYTGRNAFFSGGAWSQPVNHVAAAEFANRRAAKLGVPVGIALVATNGTGIRQHCPAFTSTIDGAVPAGSEWTAKIAPLLASWGDLEEVIWNQGQTAMSNPGFTEARHRETLAAIVAGIATATGRTGPGELRFNAALIGRDTATLTDSYVHAVNRAIRDAAGVTVAVETFDLPLADSVHLTNDGYIEMARRFAEGGAAAGVSVVSAIVAGSAISVTFSGALAGPTTGLTGWSVLEDGTPVTVSAATRSGNVVTLALASAPVGVLTLRHAFGTNPDVSSLTRSAVTPPGSATAAPVARTLDPVAVVQGYIGAAAGSLQLMGGAQGLAVVRGTAAGGIALRGGAVATDVVRGPVAGSIGLRGSATAVAAVRGAAAGLIVLRGSASGSYTPPPAAQLFGRPAKKVKPWRRLLRVGA
jgi:hypothetical protein